MRHVISSSLRWIASLPTIITWRVRPVTSRVSLRIQLLIAFVALFAIGDGGSIFLYYNNVKGQAMSMLRGELNSSATGLAEHLDAATVAKIHADGRMNGDYKSVQAQLQYLVATNAKISGAYIFTRNPSNPKTLLWVATSDLHGRCGTCNVTRLTYNPSTHAAEMFSGFQRPTTSPNIYSDSYGSYLSGYAPIRDAKGRTVAIVEVDMSATSVLILQNHIMDAGVRVLLIVLACVLAVVPFMAAVITIPLKIVIVSAHALEHGGRPNRVELQRAAQGRDEVSQMAAVFGHMADEVQSREDSLRRQVVQLKIEINTGRQEAEVAEITETDYFREMQLKAKRLRARATETATALDTSKGTSASSP